LEKPIHPIAKVTGVTGTHGDVRLRPLSRYFDDYIGSGQLMLGFTIEKSESVNIELIIGKGKKRRFKFHGVNTIKSANNIIGQTLFVETSYDAQINMISKKLLDYDVVNQLGNFIGKLTDVMWLPNNDVYVISNGGKEYLIPIIPEVIKYIDHKCKRIIITEMDGLLD